MSGQTYTVLIKIRNASDIVQEEKIYQSDYLFNYEGNSIYDEPVSHNRSNVHWIEFDPKFTVLKVKGAQYIQYEVEIPKNDSLAGIYWSLLMVEGLSQINSEQKGQLNISTSMRYAIQLITNIGNTGIGDLRFRQPTLTVEGDKLFLDVIMENTGERLISPEVSAEFFDEAGKSVKVFEAPKSGMYPTTSALFRLHIKRIENDTEFLKARVEKNG